MSMSLLLSRCQMVARRGSSRALLPVLCAAPHNTLWTSAVRCCSVQDIEQRAYETHDDKNARLRRPLSPHLSIYRPQYTSMFSIVHRVSGTVVAVYIATFAACAVLLPGDFDSWMRWLEDQRLGAALLVTGKLALSAPFIYHACNGVRHLTWDTGRLLSLRHVLISGLVMSACTATLTAAALLCV